MVELALNSHYSILIDSYHVKDTERRLYISKCADDIKKVVDLYPMYMYIVVIILVHIQCILVHVWIHSLFLLYPFSIMLCISGVFVHVLVQCILVYVYYIYSLLCPF